MRPAEFASLTTDDRLILFVLRHGGRDSAVVDWLLNDKQISKSEFRDLFGGRRIALFFLGFGESKATGDCGIADLVFIML